MCRLANYTGVVYVRALEGGVERAVSPPHTPVAIARPRLGSGGVATSPRALHTGSAISSGSNSRWSQASWSTPFVRLDGPGWRPTLSKGPHALARLRGGKQPG